MCSIFFILGQKELLENNSRTVNFLYDKINFLSDKINLFFIIQLQEMKPSYKGLLVLALVAAVSFFASEKTQNILPAPQRLLSQYTTTSTRSDNVVKNCAANLDRSTLVSTTDFNEAQAMRATVNSNLGVDGNKLISAITNGNLSSGITILTANVSAFAIFVGSFLIAFILILILWPCLCCCCTCPYCCPSKCCQKAEDEQYSKCELYWPTTVLVLSLLLIISASVYGFVKVSSFGSAFSGLSCSASIFIDDVLNGNVTSSGTEFFTGLNTLSNQLNNLNASLANINSNMTDLTNTGASSQSHTALTNIQGSKVRVKEIPDASTFELQKMYPSDLTIASSPPYTVDSMFKSVLGKYDNASSLVGGLYTVLDKIEIMISQARNNGATFSSSYTSVDTTLGTIRSSIDSISSSITKMDSSIGGPVGLMKTIGTSGNMGLQAFYGVFIGFGSLALLGTLLTACCNKFGCRHLIYFSCLIMFLVGLLGALISTIFSIFIPVFTWGCSFLDVTFLDQAGFKTNLGTALGSATDQLIPCMPFGDGNIISSIASGGAFNALNSVKDIFTSMGSFNNTQYQSWITSNLTLFENTINSWIYGQVIDVTNPHLQVLSNLSKPGLYTGCLPALESDSWVPTNSPNTSISSTFIACTVSGNKGDASTCDTSLLGTNCKGCMDSSALSHHGVPNAVFATRYGPASGCTFTLSMENVWNNYYIRRNTVLGNPSSTAGNTNVRERMLTATALIRNSAISSGGVFEALNLMDTLFNNIKTNLASVSTLTDAKYGLLAGLNCKIFGEDFQRIQKIMCGSLYSSVYTMRLAFGIIAYGVLFMMCCAVCTGVRHYKHMQRKEKIGDAFFKNSIDEASGQAFKRKD